MKESLANQYVSSFSYDVQLAPYDIAGSIAHVTMLGRKKIIPGSAVNKIIRGLQSILKDMNQGKSIPPAEDIHFAIETELIRRIGSAGQMMHTARSRNDQVITDLFLYLKDQIQIIIHEIKELQKSILTSALQNKEVIMPGFTHLQHAQPILFSHHLLSYAWMLNRDKERLLGCLSRLDVLPLGSAALAGTSFPIDRGMVAKLLKFKSISENSIDATASRDVAIEFLSASAILMSNLSRLAEELVIWSSSEFSFIRLADQVTTGSSIMPQKRNPDMAELVRGKTGRVYGSLMSLLTIVKGTPLAYNRDLQEDKPPIFDTVKTVIPSLSITSQMIRTMKVNKAEMLKWCESGFLAATELADFLSKKGVPFRAAHGIVQKIVHFCEGRNIKLDELTLSELKQFHKMFDASTLPLLKPLAVIQSKKSMGGTSPASIKQQLAKLRRHL